MPMTAPRTNTSSVDSLSDGVEETMGESGIAVMGREMRAAAGSGPAPLLPQSRSRPHDRESWTVGHEKDEVGECELGVLHDEVVIEHREQALPEGDRHCERERGVAGVRHDEEVRLDPTLLLDEEAVRALATLSFGALGPRELAGDEPVEPARTVLARDEDRRAITRGNDQDRRARSASGLRGRGLHPFLFARSRRE